MVDKIRKPNTIVRRTAKKPQTGQRSAVVPSERVKQVSNPTTSVKQTSPSQGDETIRRLKSQVENQLKEIAMLKQRVNKQNEKLKRVKNSAVHLSSIASRNASVRPGVISDAAHEIIKIVNQ